MTEQQRKQILAETVKEFGRKEWFRDAAVYDKHPDSGEPTLELKVNYLPLFERKEVKEFAKCATLADANADAVAGESNVKGGGKSSKLEPEKTAEQLGSGTV